MVRRYRIPRQPELLAATIAALRIHAGQREPSNRTEERVKEALGRQRIERGVAKRLLERFDSLPRSTRSGLLGKLASPNFTMPGRSREVPGIPPTTITVPTAAFLDKAQLRANIMEILADEFEREPTYTIRYKGLFCQKETSWDRFTNSDEIYVITSAVHIAADGTNATRTERHPVSDTMKYYDDVDDVEERIGPVAAAWAGNSDPVSLSVFVFEQDDGDPDKYKEDIDAIVKAALAALIAAYPVLAPLELLSGTIADAINWLLDTGDDLISTETIVLPRAILELYSTQGYTVAYQGYRIDMSHWPNVSLAPVTTNLEYHFITEHKGSGADYIVGFDITRSPALTRDPIIL